MSWLLQRKLVLKSCDHDQQTACHFPPPSCWNCGARHADHPALAAAFPPAALIHVSGQSQQVQLSPYPCVDRVGIHSSWSLVKHLGLKQQSSLSLGRGIGVWTRQDGGGGCWDFLSSCANWLLRLFLPWASQNKLRQICWAIAASCPLCWHQGREGWGWGSQSPGDTSSLFLYMGKTLTHPWEQGGSWRAAVSVHWWVSGRASAWELWSRVSSLIPAQLWGKDELGKAASKSVAGGGWCCLLMLLVLRTSL